MGVRTLAILVIGFASVSGCNRVPVEQLPTDSAARAKVFQSKVAACDGYYEACQATRDNGVSRAEVLKQFGASSTAGMSQAEASEYTRAMLFARGRYAFIYDHPELSKEKLVKMCLNHEIPGWGK